MKRRQGKTPEDWVKCPVCGHNYGFVNCRITLSNKENICLTCLNLRDKVEGAAGRSVSSDAHNVGQVGSTPIAATNNEEQQEAKIGEAGRPEKEPQQDDSPRQKSLFDGEDAARQVSP